MEKTSPAKFQRLQAKSRAKSAGHVGKLDIRSEGFYWATLKLNNFPWQGQAAARSPDTLVVNWTERLPGCLLTELH